MKPSQPPAVARWMLRHLVPGPSNEAIEGDLLEEFQRRRSAAWYWRQVLGTILGLSNLLRIGWVMVWTAAFAATWVYGNTILVALTAGSPLERVSGNWIPHGAPVPVLAIGIFFYLALPLLLFLALTRRLTLRTFALGLGAGALVIAVLPFLQFHLATPFNYFLDYVRARHWSVVLWLRLYQVLLGSAPLFVAMWAAALSRKKSVSPAPSPQAPQTP